MTDANPHAYPDVGVVAIEDSSSISSITLEVAGLQTNLGLAQTIASVDVIFPGIGATGVASDPGASSGSGLFEIVAVDGTVLYGKVED